MMTGEKRKKNAVSLVLFFVSPVRAGGREPATQGTTRNFRAMQEGN